jgi:polysaccharide biosynthesis/export protein
VGDTIQVQLFGKTGGNYTLVVNRDGAINFPELGPIQVAGFGFDEMRRMLQDRVSQQMIGVSASVSMGELRSIRVFVLGDVNRPGSHMVGSLSTVTHALLASGGVKPIGSLSNIEHKRDGRTIGTLDLYDLLLRGDTRADARLQPGDVIFVPPVGTQVGVEGEVRRPAIYELKGGATAEQLIGLAAGLPLRRIPQGATPRASTTSQDRILDLDVRSAAGRATPLKPGRPAHRAGGAGPNVTTGSSCPATSIRPRTVQHRPGMRISDLLPSLD